MPSSESDDFESADEGQNSSEKRERKKRLSSSNYSDNASEAEPDSKKTPLSISQDSKLKSNVNKTIDGWDDFDIDENETIENEPILGDTKNSSSVLAKEEIASKEMVKSQDTGWDEFDDWGQSDATNDNTSNVQKSEPSQLKQLDKDIKEVTERLAATSSKSSGWGWGWGVDSLLSTASAGITTLTNQVSQGITTVLETGIGAPDPEELAKKNVKVTDSEINKPDKAPISTDGDQGKLLDGSGSASDPQFPFGSLISGVTKFVETTGTKVISGGLDTLETIGKKTMEVLQEGDPGLAKKRAMLGLDSGDKPVLSQVLREAKAKADEEDRLREEKREAKEVHYENLFDDFEGLVHLEALEMLSRQVSMRIDERMRGLTPEKRQDIKETLQQVAELCEIPDEEEEDEESPPEDMCLADSFHEKLQAATQDLGLKLQFQPLVKQYRDILTWLETEEATVSQKIVYKRSVSDLAQATALSVELYHKAGEMLLVKNRRSTADEADALTQMTVVLTKHIGELATMFTEQLNSFPEEKSEQNNNYITNVFLEAGNSSTYIQNAFQLILPIIQIGAV